MIKFQSNSVPNRSKVVSLYSANGWSSAERPDRLMAALQGSDQLECAYDTDRLFGLANAISDGSLVVYYPHLLVLPDYHGKGIGRDLMSRMRKRYQDFHQQSLFAVAEAADFYEQVGFKRTDKVVPMWIYAGNDH